MSAALRWAALVALVLALVALLMRPDPPQPERPRWEVVQHKMPGGWMLVTRHQIRPGLVHWCYVTVQEARPVSKSCLAE